MTGERSAVIDSWLKGIRIGEPLWTRIRPIDVPVSSHFEIGWMQVEAQLLPLSVCLEQLPKRLLIGQTILSLEYRPVPAGGETFEKLVVIISDISAQVAREEAEVGQRDLLEAFQRILRDPAGFDLFLKSARRDVQCITSGDLVGSELLRCLHTLKGNSAIMGLSALGRACHELEDVLAREGALSRASLRAIEQEFSRVEGRLGSFVAASTSDILLGIEEHEAFLGLVEAHKPYGELARAARSWSQQRVGRHLSRLAEYAQKLAERLAKGQLQLQIEGGDLRLPDGFADFWEVAVHVVRNAIDHGIETPNERAGHGKGPGIIGLRATLLDGRSVVEISDDGRGIDWDRIRALSRARGIPAESQQDLLAALLSDGMSTSESISEISGRGVGMASVLKVCVDLGVVIAVQSSRGSGTTFRFMFPEQPLQTSAGAHAA